MLAGLVDVAEAQDGVELFVSEGRVLSSAVAEVGVAEMGVACAVRRHEPQMLDDPDKEVERGGKACVEEAAVDSRGIGLDSRPVRTEPAKVSSEVIVERADFSSIDVRAVEGWIRGDDRTESFVVLCFRPSSGDGGLIGKGNVGFVVCICCTDTGEDVIRRLLKTWSFSGRTIGIDNLHRSSSNKVT